MPTDHVDDRPEGPGATGGWPAGPGGRSRGHRWVAGGSGRKVPWRSGRPATRSANPCDISLDPTTPRVTYEKFPNTTRILLTSL